jgi:hypothetical protein
LFGAGTGRFCFHPQLFQYFRYEKNQIHVHHDVNEHFALRLKVIRDYHFPVDFFPQAVRQAERKIDR